MPARVCIWKDKFLPLDIDDDWTEECVRTSVDDKRAEFPSSDRGTDWIGQLAEQVFRRMKLSLQLKVSSFIIPTTDEAILIDGDNDVE